jgi:two-component system response regulator RegA
MARVLVADDSAVVRLSLSRRLRAEGLDVVERDSAAAAGGVDPDGLACALLDLDLGDGSGADVAARLRRARASLPIAFFSSETSGDALARAAAFGPVFAKPADIDAAVDWARTSAREDAR